MDEDDWVGEPPEGHISSDRADPGFWIGNRPVSLLGAVIFVIAAILIVLKLT